MPDGLMRTADSPSRRHPVQCSFCNQSTFSDKLHDVHVLLSNRIVRQVRVRRWRCSTCGKLFDENLMPFGLFSFARAGIIVAVDRLYGMDDQIFYSRATFDALHHILHNFYELNGVDGTLCPSAKQLAELWCAWQSIADADDSQLECNLCGSPDAMPTIVCDGKVLGVKTELCYLDGSELHSIPLQHSDDQAAHPPIISDILQSQLTTASMSLLSSSNVVAQHIKAAMRTNDQEVARGHIETAIGYCTSPKARFLEPMLHLLHRHLQLLDQQPVRRMLKSVMTHAIGIGFVSGKIAELDQVLRMMIHRPQQLNDELTLQNTMNTLMLASPVLYDFLQWAQLPANKIIFTDSEAEASAASVEAVGHFSIPSAIKPILAALLARTSSVLRMIDRCHNRQTAHLPPRVEISHIDDWSRGNVFHSSLRKALPVQLRPHKHKNQVIRSECTTARSASIRRCKKRFVSHGRFTPGIFTLVCPHGVTVGFSMLTTTESVNLVFQTFCHRFASRKCLDKLHLKLLLSHIVTPFPRYLWCNCSPKRCYI